MTKTHEKLDVHHHVYPPAYTEALNRNGGDPSGWYVPPWTVELDQDICRKIGVSTTILSCTAPGPDIEKDPSKAQKLARECNEFMAKVVAERPKAYGFFAAVPTILNPRAALEEIDYALDTLHADGVTLMTRYGEDNHYLGHKDFIPIWDELNKREAVVFVHPTHAVDTNLVSSHLPQPAYDYPHETGRTAIDLITSNMLRDHARKCKIILSHAGGDLPYLIDRPAGLLAHAQASFKVDKTTEEMVDEARWYYYDTTLSSSDMAIRALLALLGLRNADHVLFGSDFPNCPTPAIEYFTTQLERSKDIDAADLGANALKILPRLQ